VAITEKRLRLIRPVGKIVRLKYFLWKDKEGKRPIHPYFVYIPLLEKWPLN